MAAQSLILQARESATTALSDIRAVVRGIYPPVLADRGLESAVQALAADVSLPVALEIELGDRPIDPPRESALYFSVSECLANVLKHSGATRAWVSMRRADGVVRVQVGDDGRGGADPGGSGLRGVARRLAAFDGMMRVTSPPGSGTTIVLEVPCEPLSLRTTPSFAKD